jgi:hypothetical protein
MPDTGDLVVLDEVEQARHVENVAELDVDLMEMSRMSRSSRWRVKMTGRWPRGRGGGSLRRRRRSSRR